MKCRWIGFGLLCVFVVACGSTEYGPAEEEFETKSSPNDPSSEADGVAADDTPSSPPSTDNDSPSPTGTDDDDNPPPPTENDPALPVGSRSASNEDCCYGAKYLRCPDATACFGGFDFNKCLSDCTKGLLECSDECLDNMQKAPPPSASCKEQVAPPNVSCN